MRIAIEQGRPYTPILEYTFRLIGMNKQEQVDFVNPQDAELYVGDEGSSRVPIAYTFYADVNAGRTRHEDVLDEQGLVSHHGQTDHLATIFYLSNCLQEYNATPEDLDQHGRFRYERSCQKKFNSIEHNIVQQQIDQFCARYLPGVAKKDEPSTVFLSHDIDALYGSLLHDSWWALKNGRLGTMMRCIAQNVLRGPQWFCIDKIVDMHSERELVSTFFWMTEQGVYEGVRNADYRISNRKVVQAIEKAGARGFSQGVHKSAGEKSIKDEMRRMPVAPTGNRYHYLKFQLPDAWKEISESDLPMDASLGFAEHIGFRNNYGQPFSPYDFKTRTSFGFLEMPLHIMDITFEKYMHVPVDEIAARTIAFLERHALNAVISILWHNMYFVPYQFSRHLEQYKRILLYLYESTYTSVTPERLINRYSFKSSEKVIH